jgi:hypothetical protein
MINLHNVTNCRAVVDKTRGYTTLNVTYTESIYPQREVIEAVAKGTGIESHEIDVVLRCLREIKGFEQKLEITLFHNDDFVLEIAGE